MFVSSPGMAADDEGLDLAPGDAAADVPEDPISMQHPIMAALDGGAVVNEEQHDAEWLAAWGSIATACEAALSGLHPLHPRRHLLLEATRQARWAAHLPRSPALRSA